MAATVAPRLPRQRDREGQAVADAVSRAERAQRARVLGKGDEQVLEFAFAGAGSLQLAHRMGSTRFYALQTAPRAAGTASVTETARSATTITIEASTALAVTLVLVRL